MKSIYKPTEYEMKLIVLYVISKLKTSATYTILDYVISSVVDMNYFALQEYILNLIEVGDIAEVEIEKSSVYTLNASGEETIGFFEGKIPFSIREKLDVMVKKVNDNANPSNKTEVDFYPLNEKEYGVKFTLKEDNITMLSLDVYIGDRENAKKVCNYFKQNTNDVYSKILGIVSQAVSE